MHRFVIVASILTMLSVPVVAHDLGARAPDKPAPTGHPAPPPDPDVIRQGGDTMADAILMPVPGTSTGTTAGYADDYDEVCPYTGSTAPDVVYKLAPAADIIVDIDMLGSAYDTKIYVYREDLTLVACNDDWYPDYVSKLEAVELRGDVKYFLVIDGYGVEAGDYVVTISEHVPCSLECPPGAVLENEPPLVDGYFDEYNSGCDSEGMQVFQPLSGYLFCGVSGWYTSGGSSFRDTDWFEITFSYDGYIEIAGNAEYATFMYELGPMDCANVGVIQAVEIGPCQEGVMELVGAPGSTVWFWVGPTTFEGPVNEYDYVLSINPWLEPAVRTEPHSWSAMKALFE